MKTRLAITLAVLSLSCIHVAGQAVIRQNRYGSQVKDAINANTSLFDAKHDSTKTIFDYEDTIITVLNYIDFNLTADPEHSEGRVHWNDTDKTLEAGLDAGSALQIGQEVVMRATNKTIDTISDGSVVYVSGAQGSRPTITLTDNASVTSIGTLGVATQNIAPNQTGYITLIGLVRGYDCRNFTAGDYLWLGDTLGSLTNVRPSAPKFAVFVAVALNELEEGLLAVRPTVVQRISWATDVNARGNQSNWDLLYWHEDSARWDTTGGVLTLPNLSTYADNAAALSGGLTAGQLYKTATGEVMIVY